MIFTIRVDINTICSTIWYPQLSVIGLAEKGYLRAYLSVDPLVCWTD